MRAGISDDLNVRFSQTRDAISPAAEFGVARSADINFSERAQRFPIRVIFGHGRGLSQNWSGVTRA